MDLQPLSDQPLVIDGEQKSEGALAIHTTADQAITVTPTGRWQHQGDVEVHAKKTGLFLEEGAQATIAGNLQSQGQENQGIYLATNSQLTLKGSLVAEGGEQSVLLAGGSQLTLQEQLSPEKKECLRLDELTCTAGSHFCVQGNYEVVIGKLIYQGDDLAATPAQLAFQLPPNNRLQIKQFILPTAKEAPLATGVIPRAPLQITINGEQVDVRFDVKTLSLESASPQSYLYQPATQQPTLQMMVSGSSDWQIPREAQLIQQLGATVFDETAAPTVESAITARIGTTLANEANLSSGLVTP